MPLSQYLRCLSTANAIRILFLLASVRQSLFMSYLVELWLLSKWPEGIPWTQVSDYSIICNEKNQSIFFMSSFFCSLYFKHANDLVLNSSWNTKLWQYSYIYIGIYVLFLFAQAAKKCLQFFSPYFRCIYLGFPWIHNSNNNNKW